MNQKNYSDTSQQYNRNWISLYHKKTLSLVIISVIMIFANKWLRVNWIVKEGLCLSLVIYVIQKVQKLEINSSMVIHQGNKKQQFQLIEQHSKIEQTLQHNLEQTVHCKSIVNKKENLSENNSKNLEYFEIKSACIRKTLSPLQLYEISNNKKFQSDPLQTRIQKPYQDSTNLQKVLFNNQKEKKIQKRPKRGQYRKYNQKERIQAINLAKELNDPNTAAKICDIPLKNLKRWIENGHIRKKGGRKTQDPQMEKNLIQWIDDYFKMNQILPEARVIKEMALQFSNFNESFKASKGWYEKFLIRYKKKSQFQHENEPFIEKEEEPQEFCLKSQNQQSIYLSSSSEKYSIMSNFKRNIFQVINFVEKFIYSSIHLINKSIALQHVNSY